MLCVWSPPCAWNPVCRTCKKTKVSRQLTSRRNRWRGISLGGLQYHFFPINSKGYAPSLLLCHTLKGAHKQPPPPPKKTLDPYETTTLNCSFKIQNRITEYSKYTSFMQFVCRPWFCGVVVSTLDFESSDLGSNPGKTFSLQWGCGGTDSMCVFWDKWAPHLRIQPTGSPAFSWS